MPLSNKPLSLSAALPSQIAQPAQQAPNMNQVLETVASYNRLGQMLRQSTSMREVANQIAHIAEIAEQAVVNEADDWFDKHTVSRNMKEIKTYAKDFNKLALEADMMNQRMSALYDDMGRILERYFELPDGEADPNANPQQVANGMAHTQEVEPTQLQEVDGFGDDDSDDEFSTSDADSALPEPNIEPPRPVKEPEGHQFKKVDPLTIRAIKVVHEYLQAKNPELAKRFKALPAEKMKKCVWRLVR
jgi:hypothetical protein